MFYFYCNSDDTFLFALTLLKIYIAAIKYNTSLLLCCLAVTKETLFHFRFEFFYIYLRCEGRNSCKVKSAAANAGKHE